MKSLFKNILFALPLMTMMAACSGDNLDTDLASKDKLIVPDAVDIVAGAASQTFEVTANCGWTITPQNSWIVVAPMVGNGSSTVTVTPDANYSTASKTGSIIITSDDGVSRLITVNQAPGQADLKLTPESIEFTWEGGQRTISVICNTEWSIELTGDHSWLSVPAEELTGNGNATIHLVAIRNENNYQERTAQVVVTAKGQKDEVKTATVVMHSRNGVIRNVTQPQDFTCFASTREIKFYSNSPWSASISETANAYFNNGFSVIAGDRCTSEAELQSIIVAVDDNPTLNENPITITITTTNEYGEKGSAVVSMKQLAASLPTVSNLAYDESSITKKGATVSFNYASTSFPVETYKLQVATDDNFSTIVSETTADVTGSPMTVVLDELTSGTTFYVRVKVHNKVEANGGYSAWSNVIDFTTKAVPQEEDNDKPGINPVRKR